MKGKRILATILATSLTFAGVGDMNLATAYAREYDEQTILEDVESLNADKDSSGVELVEGSVFEESISVDSDEIGDSNEEMFRRYVANEFGTMVLEDPNNPSVMPLSLTYAGDKLSGNNKEIYNQLKTEIEKIAKGERNSSIIEIDMDKLTGATSFSNTDLGYDEIISMFDPSTGKPTNEVMEQVMEKVCSSDKILNALLADCSYELYWFFKSKTRAFRTSYSYSWTSDGIITINSLKMSLALDDQFKDMSEEDSEYAVDTAKTGVASYAAANAKEIAKNARAYATDINEDGSTSDYEILAYFKNIICDLVSYDERVKGGATSDDLGTMAPWQLISVFDGDSTTNVVCEGYAKAFAYLCEQASKEGVITSDDVYVYTVTGDMTEGTGEGPHMWNVVHMEDDNNYLVDVTNCDDGTIGSPDKLFMRGYNDDANILKNGTIGENKHYDLGYKMKIEGQDTMYYTYDDDTYNLYGEDMLALAKDNYTDEAVETECEHERPVDREEYRFNRGDDDSDDDSADYHYYVCQKCREEIREEHEWDIYDIECKICDGISVTKGFSGRDESSTFNGKEQRPDDARNSGLNFDDYITIASIECTDGDSTYSFDGENLPVDVGNYIFKLKGWGRGLGEATVKLTINKARMDGGSGNIFDSVYVGDSRKIDLSNYNIDANEEYKLSNEELEFRTQNGKSDIVSCDSDGTITGISSGEEYVYFGSKNVKDYFMVKVLPYPVSSVATGAAYTGPSRGDNVFDENAEVQFGFEDGISKASARYTINGEPISEGSTDFVLDKETGKVTINKPGKYKVKATITKKYDDYMSGLKPALDVNKPQVKDYSSETEISVFGDRDSVTLTPNATIKFDGKPIEEGIDFTIAGKEDNDTISYSYRLKSAGETAEFTPGLPVNAGAYELKADISENASMCLKAVSTTADITISKGEVETLDVYTKTYLYNTKYEDNLIDLTMFTPKDAGNKTFVITGKTHTGKETVSSAVIDGNNLKFTVDKMDEFEDNISTKISIKISSDNYSDYIQEIVIKRISCEHPENKIELKHNKLPECETAGEDSRVCSNCGEIVEAGIVVPALGHDYHDGICTREGCGVVSFELCNDISVSAESILYDGSTHVPTVTVSYKGETLTKDTDYKLTVESKTEVGEYELTVTGINKYRGLIRKKWSIVPQRGLWCADIPDQVYTGTAIKPEIEVYNNGIKLVAGKDYTISYKNNIKVAAKDAVNTKKVSIAPSVTITGKGNYADKKTVNFAIVRRSIDTAKVDDIIVVKTNKDIKITPTVVLDGKKLKQGTDYVVSTTMDEKDAIVSLKEPKEYPLYIVGKGSYTGAILFKFTITEKTLASKVTIKKIPDKKYTGNAITPDLEVTYKISGKVTNVLDNFTIEYKNNTEIGTATAIITAKPESKLFAGSKSVTFKINGEQISKAKLGKVVNGKIVSGTIAPEIYNGNAYEPDESRGLILYCGNETTPLVKGKDYTVSYSKNVNVGTATATITGKGKYTGTKKFTYKINKYDAGSDTSKVIAINNGADISVSYEKGGVAPKPIVKMGESVLVEKKDYTLKYANNTAVANKDAVNKSGKSIAPTITIEFKGNYSGKKTVAFEITKKDIGKCTLSLADKAESTKANEWKQTAAIIVDTNGKKLNAGTDYNKQFNYYSNEECTNEISEVTLPAQTTVYVKVTGIKNYEGSYIVGSYRISKTNMSTVTASIDDQTYSGAAICPTAGDIKVSAGPKNNKTLLKAGIDYEVVAGSYTNNINKGTASVTIRGLGDYYGTKVVKYKIGVNKILWWN